MLITYKGTVYPSHIDHMGHMNVQYYVQKFDQATWHLFSEFGITPTYIREMNKGMVAVDQRLTYKNEALAGDLLEIKSKIIKIKEKSIRFLHVMSNAETKQELALCELIGIHIDRTRRKSCPFPEDIRHKGSNLII